MEMYSFFAKVSVRVLLFLSVTCRLCYEGIIFFGFVKSMVRCAKTLNFYQKN